MTKRSTLNTRLFFSLFTALILCLPSIIRAQINAGPDQTICSPNCAFLSATVTPRAGTSSYTVSSIPYNPDPFNAGTSVSLSDDQYSGVINIGFTFCYYGNSYTQLLISSNNYLCFDILNAGGGSPWNIPAAVPSVSDPVNAIMGPWQDINPGIGGTIKYANYGVAPNRRFVVSYYNVPMFSCTGILYSSQIILYETTNIIETHILDKQICAGWNGGNAIHALHDPNGAQAVVYAGRNFPTQWAASNEGVRFTPNGNSSYSVAWLDQNNNLVSLNDTVTVCPNATTTYTAVVTYNCPQAIFTDQVTVNVINPPAPTIAAGGPLSFCQGGSVTLTSSSATGNVWSNGQTTQSITVTTSGNYTVTVTDVNGCVTTSAPTVVTVFPNPVINMTSTNVLCNGANNGTATANPAGGTAPYNYLWSNGQTTQTATGLAPGTYTVTVTDANGCTGTGSVTITQPANALTATPAQVDVLCFGNTTGTATANPSGGTTPYAYLWSNGQTTQTAVGLAAGTYTCTVTDANNCIANISVTITQPSQLTATTAQVDVLCFGNTTGTATANPGGGVPPYNYLWSNGQATQTASNLAAGNYSCTVTDANGCTLTVNITITQPAAALSNTTTQVDVLCNGQSTGTATVNPSGGTPAYTYLWSDGQTTQTATGLVAGNYSCVITDNNGCTSNANFTITQPPALTFTTSQVNELCNGASTGMATVSPSGGLAPYTYLWSNGGTNDTIINLPAGTYTCVITDSNNCTANASVTITEPSLLVVNPINPVTICIGQTANLVAVASGGVGPYAYAWNPAGPNVSPVVTTVYTVTATDANNCVSAPQNVTVTVNPPLSLLLTKNDSICPGQTITLTAAGSGGDGGPYVYQWTWAGGSNTFPSINVSPAVTTTYYVTVSDNCGTPSVSDSVTITVNPLANIVMNVDIPAGCVAHCVNFTDASTIATGSIVAWNWNFGDGTSSSTQNPSHCYTSGGVYDVTLTTTSDLGCTSSMTTTAMITANPLPVPEFTYTPTTATVLDPMVSFFNQTLGAANYRWDFGDKNDSSVSLQANPQHLYTDTGMYCVKLYAFSQFGCVDSVTHCLVVDPQFTLFIPNAFSPNGDGYNDLFTPKGIFINEFDMMIYNRWGDLIYRTKDLNKGWAGEANNGNKAVQEDVYVYLIKVLDNKGNKHSYNGTVTVVK